MKREIADLVRQCDVCQKCKSESVAQPGLLQPLNIPEQAWREISMDFVEGLPKSHNKEVVLVLVDRLTKYSHFVALYHPYSAEDVAAAFMENIYKLHGLRTYCVRQR